MSTSVVPPAGLAPADHSSARAVYGTLLASALVAALDTTRATPTVLYDVVWLVITMVAAALSHGYARLLAQHPAPGRRLATALHSLAGEWPMLAASAPTVIVLLLAALIEGPSGDGPVRLALGINVLALFGWGIAGARYSGYPRAAAVAIGVVDAAFGVLIIALNVLVK